MSLPRLSSALYPLGALLLVACSHGHDPKSTPSASAASQGSASSEGEPARPDLKVHMGNTFWDAVFARDALLAGELEAAQASARALRERSYGDTLPADWKTFIGDMRAHADALAMAPDLETASVELGSIALSCGNCHWFSQRGPEPLPAPVVQEPKPGEEELMERMMRHAVASEEMWDGLISPSDEAWHAGTLTFTRAPLAAPTEDGKAIDAQTHERVEALRVLARQARVAGSHKERANLYGKLVAGCAGCHYAQR